MPSDVQPQLHYKMNLRLWDKMLRNKYISVYITFRLNVNGLCICVDKSNSRLHKQNPRNRMWGRQTGGKWYNYLRTRKPSVPFIIFCSLKAWTDNQFVEWGKINVFVKIFLDPDWSKFLRKLNMIIFREMCNEKPCEHNWQQKATQSI